MKSLYTRRQRDWPRAGRRGDFGEDYGDDEGARSRLARVAIFHGPQPMVVRFAGHFERAARSVGLEPVMVLASEPAETIRALRGFSAKAVKAAFWAGGEVDAAEIAREAIRARVPLVGGNGARNVPE